MSGAIIRDGDTVVLGAAGGADAERLAVVRDQLARMFPGVRFVVLGGVTIEGVVRLPRVTEADR